jgi:phage FluMu protein Com
MAEEYKQHKGKNGWYVASTGKWKCNSCGSLLRTKSSYEYFKGICYPCRLITPSHIPEEQILKWLKKKKRLNNVYLAG